MRRVGRPHVVRASTVAEQRQPLPFVLGQDFLQGLQVGPRGTGVCRGDQGIRNPAEHPAGTR